MSLFRHRVAVLSCSTGMYVRSVHREMAEAMVISGQAARESDKFIRLTNAPIRTSEMERHSVRHKHAPRPRRADSSHGDSGRADVARGPSVVHFPNGRITESVLTLTGTHLRREVY